MINAVVMCDSKHRWGTNGEVTVKFRGVEAVENNAWSDTGANPKITIEIVCNRETHRQYEVGNTYPVTIGLETDD